jgi:hypothetical protein
MTTDISAQKKNLQQKKQRLLQQETMIKIRERKARTRALIEVGGLVVKAKIDHLPSDALLGALLSIKEAIKKDSTILADWAAIGAKVFASEVKNKVPVIIKLKDKPEQHIRDSLRNAGLRWNTLRQEWYGYVLDLDKLKADLKNIEYSCDEIPV